MRSTIPALAALAAVMTASAAAPDARRDTPVRVCVTTKDTPAVWKHAVVRVGSTDTVVPTAEGDVPWRRHFASAIYAEGRPWYESGEPIRLPRRGFTGRGSQLHEMEENRIIRFREPRVFLPEDFASVRIIRKLFHDGVPVFMEGPDVRETTHYFIPVRPGCIFQALQPWVWY